MAGPSNRQGAILKCVIDAYVACGQPVGSRRLVREMKIDVSPSTIRGELARLEDLGLLDHPHTSAGRVPTESGYRYYVDVLLKRTPKPTQVLSLELSDVRRELDVAMSRTAEILSRMTNLLAIVSAPPLGAATVRHVELLLLQPRVVMVVVITSTGGVTKRLFTFDEPVDPGLAGWAGSYLNENLVGLGLGGWALAARLDSHSLTPVEQGFVDALKPAFTELEEVAHDTLYVEGARRLVDGERFGDISQIHELMTLLERRYRLFSMLRSALDEREVYLRIGSENEAPELRGASMVAANYGLAHRNLGTVGVIGPMRMDYAAAIAGVRQAAAQLSTFVEDVFHER